MIDGYVQTRGFEALIRKPIKELIVHVKGSEEKLEVSRTFNHLFKQM